MEKRKTVPIYYMHIVATARAPHTHEKLSYKAENRPNTKYALCPRKTSDCDAGGHEICTFFTKKKKFSCDIQE